jgi:hypothetical protein
VVVGVGGGEGALMSEFDRTMGEQNATACRGPYPEALRGWSVLRVGYSEPQAGTGWKPPAWMS